MVLRVLQLWRVEPGRLAQIEGHRRSHARLTVRSPQSESRRDSRQRSVRPRPADPVGPTGRRPADRSGQARPAHGPPRLGLCAGRWRCQGGLPAGSDSVPLQGRTLPAQGDCRDVGWIGERRRLGGVELAGDRQADGDMDERLQHLGHVRVRGLAGTPGLAGHDAAEPGCAGRSCWVRARGPSTRIRMRWPRTSCPSASTTWMRSLHPVR